MENKSMNKTTSYQTIRKNDDSTSIIRFELLSWEQIDQLDRKKTLFFLPISPLEEHGPHLPVGTDLLTAKDITTAAIHHLNKKYPTYSFILLPALPIGFSGFNTDFPGTVSVSSRMVQQVVYQYGHMLARNGFTNVLICSYHMALGHLKGIYKAMKKLHRKYNMKICEPWSPVFYSDQLIQNEPDVGFETHTEIHADFRETSLMKYTHSDLVDERYKTLPFVYKRDLNTVWAAFRSFKQLGISKGYIGTPSKADKEYGKWFFDYTVNIFITTAEKMIQNKELPDLPAKLKRQMTLLFWL